LTTQIHGTGGEVSPGVVESKLFSIFF